MAFPKGARTGLLLILTTGPILVILFLYLFGKNNYSIDQYNLQLKDFAVISDSRPGLILLFDTTALGSESNRLEFMRQKDRLDAYWRKMKSSPKAYFPANQGNNPPVFLPAARAWRIQDTVVEIQTAQSSDLKRLPQPPRAFLFDEKKNLRGVYGLCNALSMDTLMLEFSIANQP
jgi:hypothetical protein